MHEIVTYKQEDGKLKCFFHGRLDSGVSGMIEDELIDHILLAQCPVVFDFENVEFVSSSFLRLSIKAARSTPDMQITIQNANSEIKQEYGADELKKIFVFAD